MHAFGNKKRDNLTNWFDRAKMPVSGLGVSMKIDKKRLKKRINDQDEPKNKGKLHDDVQELHHFILAVQKKDNVLS